MKSPSLSKLSLPTILLSLLTGFTLPQPPSHDNSTIATSPLPPHSSSLIIPASTFSPDATSSYLITFTPTSPSPPPLPRDALNYCFSRLRILASRQSPPSTPVARRLICSTVDCEVVVKPVAALVINYGELEYLLREVGAWIAGRGGEEKGWREEGVQRWYRSAGSGQRVELVEVVVGRMGGGVGVGDGGRGGVDVDR